MSDEERTKIEQIQQLRDEILGAYRNEIQEAFDRNFPKLFEDVRESIKVGLSQIGRLDSESHPAGAKEDLSLKQELDLLKAKNQSLEDRILALNEENGNAQLKAAQRIRDAELKSRETQKTLHRIILENSLGDSGPTDDDIDKAFGQLRHKIEQFVWKYCRNHREDRGRYGHLPTAAKDSYVVAAVSRTVYDHLFAPGVKIFGFSKDVDDFLAKFEQGLLSTESVPTSDIIDWRVRTCQLSTHYDSGSLPTADWSSAMVKDLSEKLDSYWNFRDNQPKLQYPRILSALEGILHQAFSIAILFRRAKVEYRWPQRDKEFYKDMKPGDEVDVVETAGYKTFKEAVEHGNDFKIVFAGVTKGAGPSGQLADGVHLLRKFAVLLGPFH